MKKRVHIILLFILISIFFACGDQATETVNSETQTNENIAPARKVVTQNVEEIEYAKTIFASGQLATKDELKLSFKTGGIIKKIYVNEGQNIRNGQLLAELNLNEIVAKVQQAKLGMKQAEITIENAELGVRRAQREFDAATNLFRDSVATSEQLDDAEIQLNNARNQLEAAKTGLDFNQKNVDVANFNLNHSKIIAPANGVVLKKLAQSNELIGPGNPVFIFGSKNKAQVIRVNLTDKDIIHVNVGDKTSIQFDAYPNQKFEGRVQEMAAISDPYTGTYQVEVSVQSAGKKLLPGFIGKVEIFTKEKENLLQLPINAMVSADKNKAIIFIADDNKAVKNIVSIHSIEKDKILVNDGIELGQQVIISGAGYLKDGDLIELQ